MSAFSTAAANSTTFGNSTGWAGSSNSTGSGNITGWGPSSDDTSSWGPLDCVSIFASHVDTKRLTVSLLTWVAYDFALTIDDSINLFWNYRWSVSKAMYLISRYDSLLTMGAIAMQVHIQNPSPSPLAPQKMFLTPSLYPNDRCSSKFDLLVSNSSLNFLSCNTSPWVVLVGSTILIIVVNFAMMTRVYALWNRDIRILALSLFGFSLNIGCYVIFSSYSYAKGFSSVNFAPFTGCTTFPGYEKSWVIFMMCIGFETVMVCLTVFKSWSVAVQRGIKTPLYTQILEDGVTYYIIIIISQILTIAAFYVPSSISGPITGSSPTIAICGIACNRLFTRLQRLLLERGVIQSGFPTEDFATSSSPQISYGGGIITKQRSPSPRLKRQSQEKKPQPRRSSQGTRLSTHFRSSGSGGSCDLGMGKVLGTSRKSHDSGIHGRLERGSWRAHSPRYDDYRMSGSLDKEIDLSGHYRAVEAVRKSHDIPDHHKPPREGEVEVMQSVAVEASGDRGIDDEILSSHENDGPFTHRSGKSVLDPSPRFTGEFSNVPEDDVGRLTVSRVGRYD